MATKTRLVQIGNSRGIRVAKALLDPAQLPDEVELQAGMRVMTRRPTDSSHHDHGPGRAAGNVRE